MTEENQTDQGPFDLDPEDAIEQDLIEETDVDEAEEANADVDGEPETVEGAEPVDEDQWAEIDLTEFEDDGEDDPEDEGVNE